MNCLRYYGVLFCVNLILLSSCELFTEPGNCLRAKDLYKIILNGKIEKKYIWIENHGYRILEIRSPSKEIYNFICGWSFAHEDFYEFVQVGDSIHKEINSLDIEIIKTNRENKHFLINYNCPNMDFIEGD